MDIRVRHPEACRVATIGDQPTDQAARHIAPTNEYNSYFFHILVCLSLSMTTKSNPNKMQIGMILAATQESVKGYLENHIFGPFHVVEALVVLINRLLTNYS